MQPYNLTVPFVFMHVPKSGGTSLIRAVSQAICPDISFGGFDRALFGDFDGFEQFGSAQQAIVHLDDHDIPKNAQFIAAHMSKSTLVRNFPHSTLMTLLREPTSRLLSLWLYWRSMSDQQLDGWGREWSDRVKLSRLSLRSFLQDPRIACQTDNQTTRMLLWKHRFIDGHSFIDARYDKFIISDAFDSLVDFQYVDFVENDDLSKNMTAWLGRQVVIEHLNKTDALPANRQVVLESEMDEETMHLLNSLTRLDASIWAYVVGERSGRGDRPRSRERIIADTLRKHSKISSTHPAERHLPISGLGGLEPL